MISPLFYFLFYLSPLCALLFTLNLEIKFRNIFKGKLSLKMY